MHKLKILGLPFPLALLTVFSQDSCHICKPLRLPPEVFGNFKHLPDPVPGDDGHYQPMDSVYGNYI